MKPLLIGEANPYHGDPGFALYPWPENSAGGRLCRLVFQLSEDDYLERFDRINLCAGRWSLREARCVADGLREPGARTLVLLGAKVAKAFGTKYHPFTLTGRGNGSHAVFLPHPSGLCRLWQEDGAYERARDVLRLAGVLPAKANGIGGEE